MAADTLMSKDLLLPATETQRHLPIQAEKISTENYSSDIAQLPSKIISLEPRIPALLPTGALPMPSKSSKKKISKAPKRLLAPASLPQARIRTIMKTAPNVSFLSQDTVALTVKVAELFVRKIAIMSHEMISKQNDASKNQVNYSDLANTVESSTNLRFLKDFIPRKITMKDFRKKNDDHKTTSSGSTIPSISIPPFSRSSITGTSSVLSSNINSTGTSSAPSSASGTASVLTPTNSLTSTTFASNSSTGTTISAPSSINNITDTFNIQPSINNTPISSI